MAITSIVQGEPEDAWHHTVTSLLRALLLIVKF